jgi:hypothetical protein
LNNLKFQIYLSIATKYPETLALSGCCVLFNITNSTEMLSNRAAMKLAPISGSVSLGLRLTPIPSKSWAFN